YTLLSGRQHFGHRCAIVIGEGKDGVYLWGQAWGKEKPANLFRGTVARGFSGQKAIQQYANQLLGQSRSLHGDRQRYQEVLQALGEFYCQGYELDWEQLYGEPKPRKISLPTYPFAREHYWIPKTRDVNTATEEQVEEQAAEQGLAGEIGDVETGELLLQGEWAREGLEGQKEEEKAREGGGEEEGERGVIVCEPEGVIGRGRGGD